MFTYDFLGYDDLMLVALIALFLVLRNLWDFVRYDLERYDADGARLAGHPLQGVSAVASRFLAAVRFPHAERLRQPQQSWPRRRFVLRHRPGHRPLKPQHA